MRSFILLTPFLGFLRELDDQGKEDVCWQKILQCYFGLFYETFAMVRCIKKQI